MIGKLRRRFRREGLFWRQYIVWAVRNVSPLIEPFLLWMWCGFFFLGFSSGRRAVMRNLAVIAPHRGFLWRLRTDFRMFWNFSATLTDTTRFHETGMPLDWEVAGAEHLEPLVAGESGIVMTAHMGNYDIGAFMFVRETGRALSVVRAAETDAETETHAKEQRERAGREIGSVEFRNSGENPALDLVAALREGRVVAIQGDRAVPHVAFVETTMFGRKVRLPAGPFALAMATGARLWPMIVTRRGPRYYRALAFPPIKVQRTGRDRDADIMRGVREWVAILEPVIREHADQWFAFYDAFGEPSQQPPVEPSPIPDKEDARSSRAWRAPERFHFAISRWLARRLGGDSCDALRRRHLMLALRAGQDAGERRFVAFWAFILAGLAATSLMLARGVVPAILAGISAPFIFWMVFLTAAGGVLFLFGSRDESVERLQQRAALVSISVLAGFLLTRELPMKIAAALWLLLVAANTIARLHETLKSRGQPS